MLRRDYLMKMLQEVFAAIAKLLDSDTDKSLKQKDIEALYQTFGNDKDFFRIAERDEIINAIAQSAAEANGCEPQEIAQEELGQRAELLAALMYADFKLSDVDKGLRDSIVQRALWLYEIAEVSSDTYSQERLNRLHELYDLQNQ